MHGYTFIYSPSLAEFVLLLWDSCALDYLQALNKNEVVRARES